MLKRIKTRIYEVLEVSKEGDKLSKFVDGFIVSLIILNVLAIILETEQGLYNKYKGYFYIFEIASVIIFSIEYIFRLWSITNKARFRKPFSGRIRFVFSFYGLIDLLAILPFYLPMIIPVDLRFVRLLRIFRIARMFKLSRYSASLQLFGNVIRSKKEDLLITIFIVLIMLVTASSLMYYFESEIQPEAFPSIISTMWWGVATLTTVGYGDVYPVTAMGKILGSILAVLGIGMFALPTGILASGFSDEIHKTEESSKCPHCGEEIEIP